MSMKQRSTLLLIVFALTPVARAAALDQAAAATADAAVPETSPAESEKVSLVRLLVERGIPEAQAEAVVAELTPEDISVMVENPEMLQPAGETSSGDAALVLILLILLFLGIAAAAAAP